MDHKRWVDLTFGDHTQFTPEELAAGWHWCPEWDDMVVGPDMIEEWEICTCYTPEEKEKFHGTDGVRGQSSQRAG